MWTTTGTTKAAKCGHTIAIQAATNDRGEPVTRIDGYTDPDDPASKWDGTDLCLACYTAAMERRSMMTLEQVTAAFGGKRFKVHQ